MEKTARYRKLISSFAMLLLLSGCGQDGGTEMDADATISPRPTSYEGAEDSSKEGEEKITPAADPTPSTPAKESSVHSGKDLSQIASLPQKDSLVANDFLLYFVL